MSLRYSCSQPPQPTQSPLTRLPPPTETTHICIVSCRNSQPGKRPAVLLHHGITLSSDGFVLYGPTESLAFRLADEGGHSATSLPDVSDRVQYWQSLAGARGFCCCIVCSLAPAASCQ
jgi:hypothetical protein